MNQCINKDLWEFMYYFLFIEFFIKRVISFQVFLNIEVILIWGAQWINLVYIRKRRRIWLIVSYKDVFYFVSCCCNFIKYWRKKTNLKYLQKEISQSLISLNLLHFRMLRLNVGISAVPVGVKHHKISFNTLTCAVINWCLIILPAQFCH